MTLATILSRTARFSQVGTRSLFNFRAAKQDHTKPNWLGVGLAFGTSAVLWAMLIKEHSDEMSEYKVRNGLQ